MKLTSLRRIAAAPLLTLACSTGPAFAHDGHGLVGSHWHATDVGGFVALAVGIVLAVWLSRGGK